MTAYYLLLDVGGTEIKINGFAQSGEFIFTENKHEPSLSLCSKDEILAHFKKILFSNMTEIEELGYQLGGVGLAFPGPFDYNNGICLIRGFRKFESIYGVNLKEQIATWLKERNNKTVPIIFSNDATCFALGEYHTRGMAQKGIFITLGTGCGSGFINQGHLVYSEYGLNQDGMIYDSPFKEGVIDDYLSINGLKHISQDNHYSFTNGLDLSIAAKSGDVKAKKSYDDFGVMIGEALKPFVLSFSPQTLIFGGQLSKSLDLFKSGIISVLGQDKINILATKNTSGSTLLGIYYQILDKEKELSYHE